MLYWLEVIFETNICFGLKCELTYIENYTFFFTTVLASDDDVLCREQNEYMGFEPISATVDFDGRLEPTGSDLSNIHLRVSVALNFSRLVQFNTIFTRRRERVCAGRAGSLDVTFVTQRV